MKSQSSGYSILTKLAFLLGVVLFTILVIFTMFTRQSQYVLYAIAIVLIPMFFAKKDSRIFQFASTLVLLLAIGFFSTQLGVMLPGISTFHLAVFFISLLFPILITKPRVTLYFYLMILFMFSSSSYGMPGILQAEFFNVYGKGTWTLGYSFLSILLFCLFISILVHHYILEKRSNTHIECNLYKLFWLYNAVYFIYILTGMGYGVSFLQSTFYLTGVVNITYMSIFVFVLINFFKSEEDVDKFMILFLGCMAIKGIYGVFRFLFMGGDPANHYARINDMRAVVISFFDWGEGFIACIAAFFSLWMVLKGGKMLSRNKTIFYWIIIIVGTFNMLFSYRRTVWFGMALVFLWLFQYLSAKQRVILVILTLVIGSTIFMTLVHNRFGTSGEGFIQSIAPDAFDESTGELTVKGGRFFELYVAWQTVKKNLLFGIGPWGLFSNLEKEGLHARTTHSSIMFMLLKMGLVGLIIYLAIMVAYVKFWLKARREEWHSVKLRAFGEAGFAGFVFFIPSIFFAPMIMEYRTMSFFGLSLALPYVAYYFNRKKIAGDYKLDNSD